MAVVCGQVSAPQGLSLVVLDFDLPGFETWSTAYQEIAESTWISATGRDGGRHVWLLVPRDLGCSTFAYGDIKAEGGYIVAPPSRHPGGNRYRWLNRPAGLAAVGDLCVLGLCRAESRGAQRQDGCLEAEYSPVGRPPQEVLALADGGTPVERLVSRALQQVKPGTRNTWGFWLALQLRDNGCDRSSAEQAMLRYQEAVGGTGDHEYSATEALRTLHSAYSRPAREPWPIGG
jgi:hypothetical protein